MKGTIMRKLKRLLCVGLLSLVLTVQGCSDALTQTFRAGLSITPSFVAVLAAEGVITQAVASVVTADITDSIDAAVICDRCLKAIPSSVTGKLKQTAKAKCYVSLAINLRAILDRHNIGGVTQLERIARIIEAGISAFEEYARNVDADIPAALSAVKPGAKRDSDSVTAESATAPPDPVNADKKLERSIKTFKDDLREATKTPDPDKPGQSRYLFPRNRHYNGFLLARR